MIPVEDNYIFTLPILFLTIKELNYDITFEVDLIIEKIKENLDIIKQLKKKQ